MRLRRGKKCISPPYGGINKEDFMEKMNLWIIALVAIITVGIIGCGGDDTPKHEHQWGEWIETTPATLTGNPLVETDGVETRTCSTCSEKETRSISFRSYFYGIWNNTVAGVIVTINANSLTLAQNDIFTLKIDNPNWTATKNTYADTINEYPAGYSFNGINSAPGREGGNAVICFFINVEKNKINDQDDYAPFILTKQNK